MERLNNDINAEVQGLKEPVAADQLNSEVADNADRLITSPGIVTSPLDMGDIGFKSPGEYKEEKERFRLLTRVDL